MKARDLDREMNAAARAVRLAHILRIESLGVPRMAIARVAAILPPFGVQRVRWLSGCPYEPDDDGESAVIMPVPAAERGLGEIGLVDLLAFSTNDPRKWSWRTGDGWALGEWCLDDHEAVVVETPLDWLARSENAICVLNWSAPARCWSALRSVPSLRFANETLRARAERAMRQAIALPDMGIIENAA